jgi:hypothetical protein
MGTDDTKFDDWHEQDTDPALADIDPHAALLFAWHDIVGALRAERSATDMAFERVDGRRYAAVLVARHGVERAQGAMASAIVRLLGREDKSRQN